MSEALTIILFALAAFVALGNLLGVLHHVWRSRGGATANFSTIPLLSIVFAVAALLVGPEPIGHWVLLPAILDPATWSLLFVPVHIVARWGRGRGRQEQ